MGAQARGSKQVPRAWAGSSYGRVKQGIEPNAVENNWGAVPALSTLMGVGISAGVSPCFFFEYQQANAIGP